MNSWTMLQIETAMFLFTSNYCRIPYYVLPQREKLRTIFLNFCRHGSEDAQRQSCMQLLPFMLLAREACIMTAQTGHAQLMAVFKQHAATAAATEASAESQAGDLALTFQSWLDTLQDLAQQLSFKPASQLAAALGLVGAVAVSGRLQCSNRPNEGTFAVGELTQQTLIACGKVGHTQMFVLLSPLQFVSG